MKTGITIFCFMLLQLMAVGQTVKVFDHTSLLPLPGVTVYAENPRRGVATNGNGEFKLEDINSDTLYFTLTGYQSVVLTVKAIEKSGYVVKLKEKSFDLNEIVVSASRFEEKRSEVAQQIETINAKEIQTASQPTTAELLQQNGAVMVQKSQLGGGSPIIRGFEANKVLIVIDGVRMNNAIYRGGHLQNVITVDNSVLEKVEIVMGPGSVIYGSDALGGVMHFYTKKPELADSGSIVRMNSYLRYSTAMEERSGHLDFVMGWKKFSSLSSITFSEFGDLSSGKNRNPLHGSWGLNPYYVQRINKVDSVFINPDPTKQRNSRYSQYDFMQKFLFRSGKKTEHILNLQASTSSNIPRYDRLNLLSGGLPRFAEWYYGPQQRLFGSYNFNYSDTLGLFDNLRILVSAQDIEESRNDRRLNNKWLNHRKEQVSVYAFNLDAEKKAGIHEIRYGAEATHNDVVSVANRKNILTEEFEPLDTRYPAAGSSMSTYAAYISHTMELSPKFIVSEGLRFSHIDLFADFSDTSFFKFPFQQLMQNNNAVNGNIGVVLMPSADWRFSLVGSSGFRAPNIDDVGKVFESVPGSVILPNADLKPEYTYNLDLGASKVFAERVKLEVTGFYTWFKNVITVAPSAFNGSDSILFDGLNSRVLANLNAGEAYLYGFNSSLRADITNSFSIRSSLNYTFGRIKTDSTDYPLDHIPPLYGKTSFLLNLDKFRSEFFVMYNGWKSLKDYNVVGEDNIGYALPEGTPGWFTLNLRGSYQVNRYLQLQAAIENILDEHYRGFGSGISAPGRNFIFTVRTRL